MNLCTDQPPVQSMRIHASLLHSVTFLLFIFLFISGPKNAQGQNINHWETVVFDNDTWRYLVPQTEPEPTWRSLSFDDTSWPEGVGGFGYGDDDDGTVLENAATIFTRIAFSISDTSAIASALLHVDYDDAFVAYINDVEIARAGIGMPGDRPAFDALASSLHEATLYTGGTPANFTISKSRLSEILQEGTNVLAVQVHNANANSSDLSLRTFLSVGLITSDNQYRPTPSWFIPPINNTSGLVSTLPIISIDTQGQLIPDEPKIIARMGVIDNGPGMMNALDDPFNNYDDPIAIEVRGSSSQAIFPKKSFGFETRDASLEDQDVSLLGLPEEEDWILYAPYSDKSLMRNVLVYHLANRLGRYASRTRFAEVVINGEYQGVYVLMERIKRDKNRVDISKLNPEEVSGDDLTGGYIIKIDKTTGAEVGGWQSPHPPKPGYTQRIFYQYHYPKPSVIVPAQEQYIQDVIATFETMMLGPNFADPVEGYAKYIDVDSAIDFYILNEISKNVDGYRLSTFLYKDKDSEGDGKLVFGPIWDFNLGFGNADYYNGGLENGFQAAIGVPQTDGLQPPFWWAKLWKEPSFNARLIARWQDLRENVLQTDSLMQFIDDNLAHLENAPTRNFDKWRILGTYVWPNRFVGNTFEQEINYFKDWIAGRMRWIDSNLGGAALPPEATLPATTFELSNVYPNPMINEGNVTLTIGRRQPVRIEIYDLTGRLVALPFDGIQSDNSTQTYSFSRDLLAAGMYLVRAVGTESIDTKKLVIQ